MSKKEATKTRLQAAALRLMTAHGYESTTAEQIAIESGVSTMTFFRHFQSKDMVVLDDPYDPMIGAAVAAEPTGLPPLERARRGLIAAWSAMPEPEGNDQRACVRLIAQNPELRAKAWERNAATREAIVAGLAGDGVDRLSAQVAAGACLGALEAALLDWGINSDGTLGERIASALAMLGHEQRSYRD